MSILRETKKPLLFSKQSENSQVMKRFIEMLVRNTTVQFLSCWLNNSESSEQSKIQKRKEVHVVNLYWRTRFLLPQSSYVMLEEPVKTNFRDWHCVFLVFWVNPWGLICRILSTCSITNLALNIYERLCIKRCENELPWISYQVPKLVNTFDLNLTVPLFCIK